MLYGLKKEAVDKIVHVLQQYDKVTEAVLYGSRAKGNFKSGSDIDLTLKGNELVLRDINRISLDLDDLLLPYTFDISIYHHINNPDLIDHIHRVGKTLYQQNKP